MTIEQEDSEMTDAPSIHITPPAADSAVANGVDLTLHTMMEDLGNLTSGYAASEPSVTSNVNQALQPRTALKRDRTYYLLDAEDEEHTSKRRSGRVFRPIRSSNSRGQPSLMLVEVRKLSHNDDTSAMFPITEEDLADNITQVDPLDDADRMHTISEDTALEGRPLMKSSAQEFGNVGEWESADPAQYDPDSDDSMTLDAGPVDEQTEIEAFLSARGDKEERHEWWLK